MNLNNVKKYIKLRQAFADLQEQLAHVDKQFLRGEDEIRLIRSSSTGR